MGTLKDIEANIKNKEDLDYVKLRFSEFLDIVLDQFDYIIDYRKDEIEKMEKKQKQMDMKMSKMEQIVNHIEKDIYDTEDFDLEIVCPYCDHEFVAGVGDDGGEIECPECHNIIELDWTGDIEDEEACSEDCHSCGGCHHGEDLDDLEEDLDEDEFDDDDFDDDIDEDEDM